jgi:release factor glutamine methyltransferase
MAADEAGAADGTISWRALRGEAEARLAAALVEAASQEARWLVEEASGFEGAEHHLRLDDPATERGVARFDAMLARRESGEPLAYVLGRWPFRTLDLAVDRRVLIPRPETEEVAGHALAELDRLGPQGTTAVDLGTGSGAIALSLAAERNGVDVWATDRSADALAVARANLAGIGMFAAPRVRLVEGDWFDALPADLMGRVGVVVSNPPYVAPTDPLPTAVADWEPAMALVPGATGLEAIDHIITEAPRWLATHGSLVVEIGATQGDEVRALASAAGFTHVEVRPDLAGHDRALVARLA